MEIKDIKPGTIIVYEPPNADNPEYYLIMDRTDNFCSCFNINKVPDFAQHVHSLSKDHIDIIFTILEPLLSNNNARIPSKLEMALHCQPHKLELVKKWIKEAK